MFDENDKIQLLDVFKTFNWLWRVSSKDTEIDKNWLEGLRFHDLRHEATSRIAEKVSNIIELASITGHKDVQMLKRYYNPRIEILAKKLG